MTASSLHPRQALFGTSPATPRLPVCDHYCGVESRMRKSLAIQAEMCEQAGHVLFDVTLDLEDGAPVGGEHEHAIMVAEMINSAANLHARVGVRVHPLEHPRFDEDIATLLSTAGQRLAYVMVPKLSSEASTRQAIARIREAAHEHGRTAELPVHGLVETLQAVQQVAAIARVPGLQSLSFGLMDFVSEHRGAIPADAMTATGQFSHPLVIRAKLDIAAACHAAGITPSHCVVTEFRDRRALAHAAHQASHQYGYTRMWSIHPDQIATIIEAFAPLTCEIDDAVAILSRAQANHWAPIDHHGVLHDRASYRHYWHVLEQAWITGQPLPAEVEESFFAAADQLPAPRGA